MPTSQVLSVVGLTSMGMGVRGAGEQAAAALRRRPYEHPYAIPPFLDGQGLWQIRQVVTDPLGYVRQRPVLGGYVSMLFWARRRWKS